VRCLLAAIRAATQVKKQSRGHLQALKTDGWRHQLMTEFRQCPDFGFGRGGVTTRANSRLEINLCLSTPTALPNFSCPSLESGEFRIFSLPLFWSGPRLFPLAFILGSFTHFRLLFWSVVWQRPLLFPVAQGRCDALPSTPFSIQKVIARCTKSPPIFHSRCFSSKLAGYFPAKITIAHISKSHITCDFSEVLPSFFRVAF